MRGGSAPQGPNYREKVAKTHTHYMDLINAYVDEDTKPCYVLCGLSYLERPMDGRSNYLELAIIGDKQTATCPYCIDVRANLEARDKNIREVLY
jgi:hypothetical protein